MMMMMMMIIMIIIITDMYLCVPTGIWFAGVCCKVMTPSTGSARRVSVLPTSISHKLVTCF